MRYILALLALLVLPQPLRAQDPEVLAQRAEDVAAVTSMAIAWVRSVRMV